MKSVFLNKLIERLDRLDPKSLEAYLLRLSQEQGLLETIFQSIQEGIIVIDGLGKLKYANKAAEHLIGFSMESAKGRPVSRYFREVDWDRILNFDENEWSKLISREIEITYPEHRYLSFYIVPMSSRQSKDQGAVIILRNVTHDREHESIMLESERFNAVKLLAAGVAHEIGNPLNALNIHLQLLDREIKGLKGNEKDNLVKLVNVARNEISRLDAIITQFLQAVRPSKPSFVLSGIDNLLKQTLTLMKQEIQNRNINIEIDSPRSLPKIRVDRDQIKQTFFNIIKNAFQSMPGGGLLRISLSNSDKFLEISFQDTGTGISPENLGHIFEPYHTTKSDGTGLGLMIIQRIIQDHGGQIEIDTKPSVGTNFTILLPLAERRIRLLKAPVKKHRYYEKDKK